MAQKLEATLLRDNQYAVRPAGCLGTCGWLAGVPWSVIYVKAVSHNQAIYKALHHREHRHAV